MSLFVLSAAVLLVLALCPFHIGEERDEKREKINSLPLQSQNLPSFPATFPSTPVCLYQSLCLAGCCCSAPPGASGCGSPGGCDGGSRAQSEQVAGGGVFFLPAGSKNVLQCGCTYHYSHPHPPLPPIDLHPSERQHGTSFRGGREHVSYEEPDLSGPGLRFCCGGGRRRPVSRCLQNVPAWIKETKQRSWTHVSGSSQWLPVPNPAMTPPPPTLAQVFRDIQKERRSRFWDHF